MKFWKFAVVFSCATLLSACVGGRSPETQYYQLTAHDADTATGSSVQVPVALESVILPDYLKRVQIVSRQSDYQLKVQGLYRWAGLLEENINRVLLTVLEKELAGTRVLPAELIKVTPNIRVSIYVQQFDGMPEGSAVLDFLWQIKNGDQVDQGRKRLVGRVEGASVLSQVEAQSRLLGQAGSFLAMQIRAQVSN